MTQPNTSETPPLHEAWWEQPQAHFPARARLVLDYSENGERMHTADYGYAKIEGDWVLWKDDEFGRWQSWPREHVVCIDWEPR